MTDPVSDYLKRTYPGPPEQTQQLPTLDQVRQLAAHKQRLAPQPKPPDPPAAA